MRTTLTIDDDNAVRLERLRKKRATGFKEIVNEAIRSGLDRMDAPQEKREPFRIRTVNLGEPLFKSPGELKELIAQLDEEEDLRKLGLK